MLDLTNIPFIPGLELSQRYHDEVVGPLLRRHYPDLSYAAGRLGAGSDVHGFDTPQSRDHDWGPRMTIYLDRSNMGSVKDSLLERLRFELPLTFYGYPTNFEAHEDGALGMSPTDAPPVNHHITVTTVGDFFEYYLSFDPAESLTLAHWLSFPEQRLRTIRSGHIFHDDSGKLSAIRESLDYYPGDLRLYLMAVAWRRIDQEEPFIGRAGDVDDELGSRLIAARQLNNIVRLCFLMEEVYAPYSKWLGTAFSHLESAAVLMPLFEEVLGSESWRMRQEGLTAVYEELARRHNDLGITPPLPTTVSSFHGRPYMVIHAGRFVDALRAAISDPLVKELPIHLGSIDQFVDSTDVLAYPKRFSLFREILPRL